ncbi:hypothetical protein V2J09_000311 [Rumex salicifolius]
MAPTLSPFSVCIPKESDVKEQRRNVKAAENNVFSPDGSDGQEGEIRDQLGQLSLGRDPEAGIRRLARVSAQFLPPEGSRTVKIPSGNYELRYSFLSQRGYYPDALDKANQDSFCIHTPFGTNGNDHLFGVFDGHGEYGAQCSQFVKRRLCENLLRNGHFHTDPIEACHEAFVATNTQLNADNLDDSMSGTTAVTVLVRDRTIYVANAGDSRAVIAQRKGKDIVAVDLSIDQTPYRPDELERVKLCGARVLTLDQIEGLKNPDVQCWGTEEADDGDPPRLWVPHGMYPGTAFTRSIGDSIAETIGVVANPEIVVLELTPEYPFFVLASDGVFEFLSSQSVVDMVAKCKDPRDACAAIVAESYRLWLQYETRTDDITIIVVHINGLKEDAVTQLATPNPVFKPSTPQIVEVTGSESPSTIGWGARNQRVRQDLSRARLRAIESSLENGAVWVPPSPSHRKTWEEEAHIQRALHDHFLFRKLTDSQCHVLLDCMQRIEVQAGDIVVQKGGEGECFYVVGSGEFEVLATQEEQKGEVPRVLHRYTAEKLSSFGELALMNTKPLQASVHCVTSGTLWSLKREDFRGILMSEFSNLSSLKLLRSVDLLSKLTILQLSQIADSLSEISFSDRQTIVEMDDCLSALYIIQKGQVRIEFESSILEHSNVCSLTSDFQNQSDVTQSNKHLLIDKFEGEYFGEWSLFGEQISQLRAVATGDVVCSVLKKEQFDSIVGPLTKSSQEEKLIQNSMEPNGESDRSTDPTNPSGSQLSELEWRRCIYSTDCSEVGLVAFGGPANLYTLKRFPKDKVIQLGKKDQVLKERDLIVCSSPCSYVPQIFCTFSDETHAGMLLNTSLACPFSSVLHKPLDEASARICAASVVIALEDLHKNGVLYRGISPEMLMFDQAGYLQLVDFRFGKKISSERTFTICGMADSLAPEIVQGKGHGFPADWWALGALIYFMLQGDMPFGTWRENELDTFAKIAKGQFTLPESFSPDAVDLITKFLVVDENERLGSDGPNSVKSHPWFVGIDWETIANKTFPVPVEITSQISHHLESLCEETPKRFLLSSPTVIAEDVNAPEWLQEW